jgi:hypothetical protein
MGRVVVGAMMRVVVMVVMARAIVIMVVINASHLPQYDRHQCLIIPHLDQPASPQFLASYLLIQRLILCCEPSMI